MSKIYGSDELTRYSHIKAHLTLSFGRFMASISLELSIIFSTSTLLTLYLIITSAMRYRRPCFSLVN